MMLTWQTRYQIALGMAKGLAYLHEDCNSKIVHCDIKPENVLLDENILAKVFQFRAGKDDELGAESGIHDSQGHRGLPRPQNGSHTEQSLRRAMHTARERCFLSSSAGGRTSTLRELLKSRTSLPMPSRRWKNEKYGKFSI